jgi:hypothetical protein
MEPIVGHSRAPRDTSRQHALDEPGERRDIVHPLCSAVLIRYLNPGIDLQIQLLTIHQPRLAFGTKTPQKIN